jgi:uncharacterized membrane protein
MLTEGIMSYSRKQAFWTAITWALIFGGLLAVVLGQGVSRFVAPDQSNLRLLTAAIILPGFLLTAWLGWRSRRAKQQAELDERDDAIARQASVATLLGVAISVYITSIVLYELHSDSGVVPTGWLYLLAYGTLALIHVIHAVATVVIDFIGVTDG